MKIKYILILFFITLGGCSSSNNLSGISEETKQMEMKHAINIMRIRHLVMPDSTNVVLNIYYSWHAPAYFWYADSNGKIQTSVRVVDVCDNIFFLRDGKIDWKVINIIKDATEYTMCIEELREYYIKHNSF